MVDSFVDSAPEITGTRRAIERDGQVGGFDMFLGNRLYLIGIAAVLIGVLIASLMLELNTERRDEDVKGIAAAEARKIEVQQYLSRILDAEAAHGAFLLSQDPSYRSQFVDARKEAPALFDRVADSYLFKEPKPTGDGIREDIDRLRTLGATKLDQLSESLTLADANQRDEAIALARRNFLKHTIDELRRVADELREQENARVTAALDDWERGIVLWRAILIGGTVLNIVLVVLVAYVLSRDLRQREAAAAELERHTHQLANLVDRRTAELSALSSHLQNVAEREKASIARELHDELGGIMLAAKMDVAWLEKRLSRPEDDLAMRWARLRKLLEDGLNLKRRVVETLRPTLLDNMGLVPAVKWLFQETCARVGLKCHESYPDQDLRLDDEASIAIFRVIQEALANIVKHAKATEVELIMMIADERLKICIRDNGVGYRSKRATRTGQGLVGMQHRIVSFGGEWQMETPAEGGTSIDISLPLARISAAPAAII